MKIFIAGGTGFIGGHLIPELLNRGHELRLLTHRRRGRSDGIDETQGDVTRAETFEAALNGCDAVINLVGIIREFPAKNITFEKMHVQATASLLSAARKAGVRRYLQMSALGTRPDAISDYHKTKWEAEKLVRGSGVDWTIFRPSLIFGPEDAFVNMLASQLRVAPIMPVIGSGDYRMQPIHADDVARCFAMSLEMPGTVGLEYNLCGKDCIRYKDMLDAIANVMEKPRPFKPHAPLWLMKRIIPVMQNVSWFPITMDQLQMLLEESVCDGSWQRVFGFAPKGFEEGIREYLRKVTP